MQLNPMGFDTYTHTQKGENKSGLTAWLTGLQL